MNSSRGLDDVERNSGLKKISGGEFESRQGISY